jgi:hypothetical protein
VRVHCCAPGSASALPAARDVKEIAPAGAFAGGSRALDAPRQAEFYFAPIEAAHIPARPKPPAVLRT